MSESIKYTAFEGINNVDAPEELTPTELRDAVNVDVTRRGRLRRRTGFTKVYNGTDVHSVFSEGKMLFVDDTVLKVMDANLSASNVRTGLQPGNPMSYVQIGDTVYYSDGLVTGKVNSDNSNSAWGIAQPAGLPTLAQTSGGLFAGTYLVTLTYSDASGRESGAPKPVSITLSSDNSGINLTNIPTSSDSDVTKVNIYVTSHNSEVLYYAGFVANGTSTYKISTGLYARKLRSLLMRPAPAGTVLERCHGRIHVGSGSVEWISEPMAYEWFDMARSYIPWPSEIKLIAEVEGGRFVCADKTYFIRGTNPVGETEKTTIHTSTAIPGTLREVDGDYVGTEIFNGNNAKRIAGAKMKMWLNTEGEICVGGPDGFFHLATRDKTAYNFVGRGAALYREDENKRQYIVTAKTNGTNDAAYASDVATMQVIRNGVQIT